jgi:hypothetical protein
LKGGYLIIGALSVTGRVMELVDRFRKRISADYCAEEMIAGLLDLKDNES